MVAAKKKKKNRDDEESRLTETTKKKKKKRPKEFACAAAFGCRVGRKKRGRNETQVQTEEQRKERENVGGKCARNWRSEKRDFFFFRLCQKRKKNVVAIPSVAVFCFQQPASTSGPSVSLGQPCCRNLQFIGPAC